MADIGVPRPGEINPNVVPRIRQNAGRKPKKVELPPLGPQVSPVEFSGFSGAEIKEFAASREAVSERITEINEVLRSAHKSIRFRMPEGGPGEPIIVEVIDSRTREVIRTIPSDALLRIKNQLEVMMGLVFDGEV